MTLADLRKAVALTQDEVAEACKVSTTTVSAWERGAAIPRLKHVRVLAEVLKASIPEIQYVIQSRQVQREMATDATGSHQTAVG